MFETYSGRGPTNPSLPTIVTFMSGISIKCLKHITIYLFFCEVLYLKFKSNGFNSIHATLLLNTNISNGTRYILFNICSTCVKKPPFKNIATWHFKVTPTIIFHTSILESMLKICIKFTRNKFKNFELYSTLNIQILFVYYLINHFYFCVANVRT